MRIQQIQLLKYGKFDGSTLDFPKATRDFHMVVGPNEAGKSTLRTAIAELLFGMPLRTDLAFLHPLRDLRLGGVLAGDSEKAAFHRVRGRTPLVTQEGSPLPDDYLAFLLGSLDKTQFEQMYCLDHDRLVAGGHSLLDASKEVGRVLFQSAAGIAGLGPVRDALSEQAGSLWAPRRGTSEYATAAARLEAATLELKSAQVRTKVWQEARAALEGVQSELAAAQEKRLALEALRAKLERVRRLGGPLLHLRVRQKELADLGTIIPLPATAMADLSTGAAKLASAEVVLREREATLETLKAAREAISYDETLLTHKVDIETLDEMRSACANHVRDLPIRRAEWNSHLVDAQNAARQIGWPVDESGLRARLPTALALKTVTRLLASRGALNEASRRSKASLGEKRDDLASYRADLEGVAASELPEALRVAHVEALAFRNADATQRQLQQDVVAAAATLDQSLAALSPWRKDLTTLIALNVPSPARIHAILLQRQEFRSGVARAEEELRASRAVFGRSKLQLQQFEHSHKVVTPTEVLTARARRDDTWNTLKNGIVPLTTGSPVLDAAIRLADELVDAQVGSATAAATLEAMRQACETAQAEQEGVERGVESARSQMEVFETSCSEVLKPAGLEGMALDDLTEWLVRRDEAITRHAAHAQCERARDAAQVASTAVHDVLAKAAHVSALAVEPDENLAALTARVGQFIATADAARTRRDELIQLVRKAEQSVQLAQTAAEAADEELAGWTTEWRSALAVAGLDKASATLAEAEGAVELAGEVAASLQAADDLRRDRIDTMQSDLRKLEEDARRIAGGAAPALLTPGDSTAISLELSQRLRDATAEAQRARDAEEAIRRAQAQASDARLQVQAATAVLGPLLEAAGVHTVADLLPLVSRSDQARALRDEITSSAGSLLADGDGLTLENMEAEVAEFASVEVPGLHEQAKADTQTLADRMNELIQRRIAAEQAVSAIAGQADAANAEAKRQEALATMGEVAERYVEATTAGKLLQWAIDRYRDRKQGPMLQRASHVFSTLTLGAFSQLIVDYEKDVPTLSARRASGQTVEVSGLSEGTRDQLFLALRIAAIELQIDSTRPMPFVADDLFINFDDERAEAGFVALGELSFRTQVIFLTHHAHLIPVAQGVFGEHLNLLSLDR